MQPTKIDDDRAVRALTDVVACEEIAPGMMRVVTWSDEYRVDARDGGCECQDKQYNEPAMCKHEIAASVAATGDLPVPYDAETPIETPAVATDGSGDSDDVEQVVDWCARDSVAAAYDDWSDHLAYFHEGEALMFWADSGTVPGHVADDYKEVAA
jgi:hypothetical protein